MRTIVDLEELQVEALARICRRDRISRAEAIRRAVDSYLRLSPVGDDDVFGLWRERRIDGRRYEDGLRDEWEPRKRRR